MTITVATANHSAMTAGMMFVMASAHESLIPSVHAVEPVRHDRDQHEQRSREVEYLDTFRERRSEDVVPRDDAGRRQEPLHGSDDSSHDQ